MDFTGVPDSYFGLKEQYVILFCQIQLNSVYVILAVGPVCAL